MNAYIKYVTFQFIIGYIIIYIQIICCEEFFWKLPKYHELKFMV